MAKVVIYSTDYCSFCKSAKRFLEEGKKVPVEEIDLTKDPAGRKDLAQRTGSQTVPQIFIGETHVGGFSELRALEARGELDGLLAAD